MRASDAVPSTLQINMHVQVELVHSIACDAVAFVLALIIQELVDAARSGLSSNQRALAALQAKAGQPVDAPSSNDAFSAAMDEFDRVMRSGGSGEALSGSLPDNAALSASDCVTLGAGPFTLWVQDCAFATCAGELQAGEDQRHALNVALVQTVL